MMLRGSAVQPAPAFDKQFYKSLLTTTEAQLHHAIVREIGTFRTTSEKQAKQNTNKQKFVPKIEMQTSQNASNPSQLDELDLDIDDGLFDGKKGEILCLRIPVRQ